MKSVDENKNIDKSVDANTQPASLEDVDNLILPNFDYEWFKETYKIVGAESRLELYDVYKKTVGREYVSPNREFNEAYYLAKYQDVRDAVKSGKILCGYVHYLRFGKSEGRTPVLQFQKSTGDAPEDVHFDEDWYLHSYKEVSRECVQFNITPLDHYKNIGVRRRYSPNSWFDEKWYNAFYSSLINECEYVPKSGFIHYLEYGKKSGCLPRRKVKEILEFKFPGVTSLRGIQVVNNLEHKLKKISARLISRDRTRINFVVPTFDKDIMFGGYKSLLSLFEKVLRRGHDVRIIITEDKYLTKDYVKYVAPEIAWDNIDFLNLADRAERVEISLSDRFVAYSAWDAHIAHDLAGYTNEKCFIFLIQEDERIFHANDSLRAIVESAYAFPHVALFNSAQLRDHFEYERLGAFALDKSAEQKVFHFDHVTTPVTLPTVETLSRRTGKRLLFYARPEAHAARNLFEIGLLALKLAVRREYFDNTWSFDGIGTLVEKRNVELGEGKTLNLMPKLNGDDYGRMISDYDMGLSLMYAPHPGLVHYEMAAAGLVVVTNLYGRRDAQYFQKESGNFVASKPDIYELAKALRLAISKVDDCQSRINNAYIPKATDWDQVFNDEFISDLLESIGV